jgi:hypothetical protein
MWCKDGSLASKENHPVLVRNCLVVQKQVPAVENIQREQKNIIVKINILNVCIVLDAKGFS